MAHNGELVLISLFNPTSATRRSLLADRCSLLSARLRHKPAQCVIVVTAEVSCELLHLVSNMRALPSTLKLKLKHCKWSSPSSAHARDYDTRDDSGDVTYSLAEFMSRLWMKRNDYRIKWKRQWLTFSSAVLWLRRTFVWGSSFFQWNNFSESRWGGGETNANVRAMWQQKVCSSKRAVMRQRKYFAAFNILFCA